MTRVLAHPAPYTAAAVLAAGLLGWLLGWVTYRATLHALAKWYRTIAANDALSGAERREARALAEHVETVAQMYATYVQPSSTIQRTVDGLLAVAAAAGVKP